MKSGSTISVVGRPLSVFVGLGGLALLVVLLPSPTRLGLYEPVSVSAPVLYFPETPAPVATDDTSAIADFPLFNADRQKDPPRLTAQEQPPGLDSYLLSGVIITSETSLAIVERKATKTTITLKVGGSLDGRVVKEITANGVSFSGPSGPEVLARPKPPAGNPTVQTQASAGNGANVIRGMGDRDTR